MIWFKKLSCECYSKKNLETPTIQSIPTCKNNDEIQDNFPIKKPKRFDTSVINLNIKMTNCSNCGENIPNQKLECPYCGSPVSPQKEKIIEEIENQGEKRKRAIATFLLSMFAMWVIPSPKIILFLAIISFGILPVLIIYHTWKKKQAENKLENSTKTK